MENGKKQTLKKKKTKYKEKHSLSGLRFYVHRVFHCFVFAKTIEKNSGKTLLPGEKSINRPFAAALFRFGIINENASQYI